MEYNGIRAVSFSHAVVPDDSRQIIEIQPRSFNESYRTQSFALALNTDEAYGLVAALIKAHRLDIKKLALLTNQRYEPVPDNDEPKYEF